MGKRIVGIDYGMKRLGMALSDETKLIASPLKVFEAKGKMELTVEGLLKELEDHQKQLRYELEAIVVGFPLMMSGKRSQITDEVSFFIELIKQKIVIPVVAWDERLTSVLAERAMMESDMTRKKRSQKVDLMSAVIILQNYLDSLRFMKRESLSGSEPLEPLLE